MAAVGGAMLGVSTINCVNGAKGKTSSFVGGFFVLIIMVGAYPVLNFIPLGVLVGMLIVVFYKTFKWFTLTAIIAELVPPSIRIKLKIHNRRIPKLELLIIIIVTVLTIVVNLLIATMVGILIAGMAFSYTNSSLLQVKIEIREKGNKKLKVYIVQGPVFYATKKDFFKLFDIDNDPLFVQIDFDHDLHIDWTTHSLKP